MAWRKLHLIDLADIPGGDEQSARIRVRLICSITFAIWSIMRPSLVSQARHCDRIPVPGRHSHPPIRPRCGRPFSFK